MICIVIGYAWDCRRAYRKVLVRRLVYRMRRRLRLWYRRRCQYLPVIIVVTLLKGDVCLLLHRVLMHMHLNIVLTLLNRVLLHAYREHYTVNTNTAPESLYLVIGKLVLRNFAIPFINTTPFYTVLYINEVRLYPLIIVTLTLVVKVNHRLSIHLQILW